MAYRTICKTPKEKIALGDKEYQIEQRGTIYCPDLSDNRDESCTYIDISKGPSGENTDKFGKYEYYTGKIGTSCMGYIATENGFITNLNENDNNTYYVRTMVTQPDSFPNKEEGYVQFLRTTMHVRAFVVVTDEKGEKEVIYGKDTKMSIEEMADYLYKESKSSNYQGHSL